MLDPLEHDGSGRAADELTTGLGRNVSWMHQVGTLPAMRISGEEGPSTHGPHTSRAGIASLVVPLAGEGAGYSARSAPPRAAAPDPPAPAPSEPTPRGRRSLRRGEVYSRPLVDGREVRDTTLARLGRRLGSLLTSEGEREEAALEGSLRSQPGPTRPNTLAVISPKGGVGKTTSTFLLGNLLAGHLKLRAVAVDANPDFGTLAALAPDAMRSERSLADVIGERERLNTAAQLRPYVSHLPTGLHVLAAPDHAEVMAQMTPGLYGELLAFLGQFYDVVLLDLGTGITDPIARFAVERADQLVVVTTPEWITAANVLGALRHLRHEHATLVLNQARKRSAGELRAVEQRFREHRLHRRVALPYDERLRTMLDSGTYSLEALDRATRVPIKQLGIAVAEQLV